MSAKPDPEGPEEKDTREHERKDILERKSPTARVVHEAIRHEGAEELERPARALAWSGLASGLSMGFSLVAEGLLRTHLPEADWTPLVSKLGYSVGFIIVILGRQQLFTENTLTAILPLLHEKTLAVLGRVAQLWGIVLLTNLIGAFAFAWTLANSQLFDPAALEVFPTIGHEAMGPSFWPMLLGAVFAGWLIALMVWLLPYAEAARLWVVLLLSYLVGLGGFAHIIAGSAEVFYLVALGELGLGTYMTGFFFPTFLGNVLGGVTLVALLNHAQVAAAPE